MIYAGSWKQVEDDDGHVLRRGERTAVCAKTFDILAAEPYVAQIVAVPPMREIPEAERGEFDCSRSGRRDPRESKGADYVASRRPDSSGCC